MADAAKVPDALGGSIPQHDSGQHRADDTKTKDDGDIAHLRTFRDVRGGNEPLDLYAEPFGAASTIRYRLRERAQRGGSPRAKPLGKQIRVSGGENSTHPRLSRRAAAPRGHLQVVRRQVGHRLRQHHRARRDRRRAGRPRRSLPARARSTCRPTPTASAPGSRSSGPHLLGEDPRAARQAQPADGRRAKGHPYVKSGIDIACWDILGQAAGLPVCELLGGRYGDDVPCIARSRRSRPTRWRRASPATAREGYRRFQLKVGGDPDVDIERIHAVAAELQPGDRLVADANTGWMQHEAMRVVRACATSTSTSSSRA